MFNIMYRYMYSTPQMAKMYVNVYTFFFYRVRGLSLLNFTYENKFMITENITTQIYNTTFRGISVSYVHVHVHMNVALILFVACLLASPILMSTGMYCIHVSQLSVPPPFTCSLLTLA